MASLDFHPDPEVMRRPSSLARVEREEAVAQLVCGGHLPVALVEVPGEVSVDALRATGPPTQQ